MNSNDGSQAVGLQKKLFIDQSICTFCAGCSSVCPVMAIHVRDNSSIITNECIDCGNCMVFCPVSAVKKPEKETYESL